MRVTRAGLGVPSLRSLFYSAEGVCAYDTYVQVSGQLSFHAQTHICASTCVGGQRWTSGVSYSIALCLIFFQTGFLAEHGLHGFS